MSASSAAAPVVDDAARASATLYYNGRIYASSDDSDLASPHSWMSVSREGRILEIARSDVATPPSSSHAAAHDLQGAPVLPGLIDAHIHVLMTGRAFYSVDVKGVRSIEQLQERLREGVAKVDAERLASGGSAADASTSWVQGAGWEQDELGRYPTKADLDAVLPDRPCVLWRACTHIFVANSTALRLGGVDASTTREGGEIDFERGLLKETATELLRPFLADSPADEKKYLKKGMEICSELGLTGVQTNDPKTWHTYKALAEELPGGLPLRVWLTIDAGEVGTPEAPKAGERFGELLECHRVKLFADGALGALTASLSKPYVVPPHRCAKMHGKAPHDHEGHEHESAPAAASADASAAPATAAASASPSSANYGILIHPPASLLQKVSTAHQAGYRLEVHVIGDYAAEVALGAFEGAGVGKKDRPILTHCQVLRSDLIDRMVAVGAIADVQPQFAVTDSKWASERLPEDLLKYSYCWRTLLERGVHVAGGSDAPIEVANPLLGMHAAIFRPLAQYDAAVPAAIAAPSTPLPAFAPDQQWRREECVSVSQALHMYTVGAAFAAGREQDVGALRPGWVADFVVLDRDVVQRPEEMLRAKPLAVYVQGAKKR